MRVLITAGPTREYLDDVRFISNASSGQMGYAIAAACVAAGHEVILISGPVSLAPPPSCELVPVETTSDLEAACLEHFPTCDGIIAAAAVCDYRPRERAAGKLKKTGDTVVFEMVETTDVLAALGELKTTQQWILGFAVEADAARENAMRKLRKKNCDYIVLNAPSAIGSAVNSVEVIAGDGSTALAVSGAKADIAVALASWLTDAFAR